ncbi:MAG: restriction endonuclease subunit S [Deltaproteobacteria bacterium]|nr:restriction endonuclease subunit S [Deltaproteobacteria bacterium]
MARLVRGAAISKFQVTEDGVPFVRPLDLVVSTPLTKTAISVAPSRGSRKRLLPAGTVLLCCYGNLGRTGILGVPAFTSQEIVGLIPSDRVDAEYLLHWCRNLAPWLSLNARGSTSLRGVSKQRLGSVRVAFPPLPEQREIGSRLATAQARLASVKTALDAAGSLLKDLRRSILSSAHRGRLTAAWRQGHRDAEPASVLLREIRSERARRWKSEIPTKPHFEPPSADSPLNLPRGWCWASVGDLLLSIGTGARAQQNKEGIGVPVTRIESVQRGKIVRSRLGYVADSTGLERYHHRAGDIVLSHINNREHIGKVARIVESDLPLLAGRNLLCMRPVLDATSEWLFYMLASPQFRSGFVRRHRRGVSQINQSQLIGMVLPLPPLDEMLVAVERVRDLMRSADRLEEAAMRTEEMVERLDRSVLVSTFGSDFVA